VTRIGSVTNVFRWFVKSCFVLPFVLSAGNSEAQTKNSDPIILFAEADPQMNAAISSARATISYFHAAVKANAGTEYMFKAAIPYGDNSGVEHVWVMFEDGTDGKYAGTLTNSPQFVDLKVGDQIEIGFGNVSDWAYYTSEGKLVGAYTIRVMVPQMNKEDQDYFSQTLSEKVEGVLYD